MKELTPAGEERKKTWSWHPWSFVSSCVAFGMWLYHSDFCAIRTLRLHILQDRFSIPPLPWGFNKSWVTWQQDGLFLGTCFSLPLCSITQHGVIMPEVVGDPMPYLESTKVTDLGALSLPELTLFRLPSLVVSTRLSTYSISTNETPGVSLFHSLKNFCSTPDCTECWTWEGN